MVNVFKMRRLLTYLFKNLNSFRNRPISWLFAKLKKTNKNKLFTRIFFFTFSAVPKPVQLLEVPDTIDKCDFLLKWKETGDNGSIITKYTVYQRIVNGDGAVQSWKDIYSFLTYEHHVDNLERGKLYEFKVKATNKIGEGEEDEMYFKKVKVEAGKFV